MVSQRSAVVILRSLAKGLLCVVVASGSLGRAVDAAAGPTTTEVNIVGYRMMGFDMAGRDPGDGIGPARSSAFGLYYPGRWILTHHSLQRGTNVFVGLYLFGVA